MVICLQQAARVDRSRRLPAQRRSLAIHLRRSSRPHKPTRPARRPVRSSRPSKRATTRTRPARLYHPPIAGAFGDCSNWAAETSRGTRSHDDRSKVQSPRSKVKGDTKGCERIPVFGLWTLDFGPRTLNSDAEVSGDL